MSRCVLIVAPWLPWPADFGGAARVYHLARGLAAQHEIMLLAPGGPDEHDALRALGEWCDVTVVPAHWTARQPAGRSKRLRQVRSLSGKRSFLEAMTWDPRFQAALDRLLATRRIDLVQFEFPQMALFRPPRPVPTVLDAHNIEHELLERVAAGTSSLGQGVFNRAEAQKVRVLERDLWRDATVCVATSQRDACTIERASGTPTRVVPNGVDIDFLGAFPRQPRSGALVFTGAMRHAPNADGARWFVEQVLPLLQRQRPDVSLAIVGADPPPSVVALAESDGVQVTGGVADVRPWLAAASVAVVPLRAGGGTRLKILEAFAASVPVVSTTLGAEGLGVRDSEQLLLADTPREFAAAVARVLSDGSLAARLATNGGTLAATSYDWTRIVPQLVAAHDLALERFQSRNAAAT
jgi:glycosyltransferase involved in cell wall biosynthesis